MDDISTAAILFSVQPKYMNRILDGDKYVEIRRIRPNIAINALILFYASSPKKQLVAYARITDVQISSPHKLWTTSGEASALTKEEFFDYLSGSSRGVAIAFSRIIKFKPPIALTELRSVWPGFHPPQSHIYISDDQMKKLMITESKEASLQDKLH